MIEKLDKKPHWISAIFKQKCPACHNGEFFKQPHGYRLKEIGDIHNNCPNCGQKFILEPGFYFGAAYLTYAMNVALMVFGSVAVYLLIENAKLWQYVTAIIGMNILLLPVMFRLSRIIWATIFIPFVGEKN